MSENNLYKDMQDFNNYLREQIEDKDKEIERLKELCKTDYEASQEILFEKEKEIKRLNKDLKDACEVIERLKEDKKKAIEYIENTCIGSILEVHSGYEEEYTKPLLDILKGSDKE